MSRLVIRFHRQRRKQRFPPDFQLTTSSSHKSKRCAELFFITAFHFGQTCATISPPRKILWTCAVFCGFVCVTESNRISGALWQERVLSRNSVASGLPGCRSLTTLKLGTPSR